MLAQIIKRTQKQAFIALQTLLKSKVPRRMFGSSNFQQDQDHGSPIDYLSDIQDSMAMNESSNVMKGQPPAQQQDIYEENFKNLLKGFCHNYQIPFLENNIPKSCRQAAKIYYRLVQDNVDRIPSTYDKVVSHLRSIPQEEIDDQFNPFKMREKWMKFFRSGFQRVLVDTDRALKNDLSDSLKAFIGDQKLTFNDKQFIKALLIMQRGTGDFKAIREKDRIINFLLNNILASKFEFKKGNTIASLAEAFDANFDSIFTGATKKPQYDVHTKFTPQLGGNTDIMQIGCLSSSSELYSKVLRVFATKLIPFLRSHYFGHLNPQTKVIQGGYHAHKKAVIISFLARSKIYDESLFVNFSRHLEYIIENAISKASIATVGSSHAASEQQALIEKAISEVVCTQDPITNNEIDRFYQVVEALDFHAQEQQNRKGSNKKHRHIISQQVLDQLISITLTRVKKSAQQTLLENFPKNGERFKIKIENLLSIEQKPAYYNAILTTMIHEIENKIENQESYQNLSPYTILKHLQDSFEIKYCQPKLVAQLLQLVGNILVEQYEPLYERLRIKEAFLIKAFSQPVRQTSAGVDETELIVDTIQQYREAFQLYLNLATNDHQLLIREVCNGLNPKVYQTYSRMLSFNDICDKFIQTNDYGNPKTSAADTMLNVEFETLQSLFGQKVANDEFLSFDSIAKKRWIDQRPLMNDQFMKDAPEEFKGHLMNIRDTQYDQLKALTKLRNQVYISYKTLFKQIGQMQQRSRYESGVSRSNFGQDSSLAQGGIMKDSLLNKSQQDNQPEILESLFQEDEDYKLKMAQQYDMLSYVVGSDFDEVKMDHLTFFKIFHQLQSLEDNIKFEEIVEKDWKQASLLMPISQGEENLLGCQAITNNTGVVKTLALNSQLTNDLHELVKESIAQFQTSPLSSCGLLSKVLYDTLDTLNPRHLASILISDLSLYRDLHSLLTSVELHEPKKIESKTYPLSSIPSISPLSAEAVINEDDRSKYSNEQLRNLNQYYFQPYLDTQIPYKESVRQSVEDKREVLTALMTTWNQIRDQATSGFKEDQNAKHVKETLINQQQGQEKKYVEALSKVVGPLFKYVDGFCTALFNQISVEDIEAALFEGQSSPKILELLSQDYSGGDDSDVSFVTGKLMFRDPGIGRSAVQEFNKALLNSGVVREFIKEYHDKHQGNPQGQSRSLFEHKREYLKYLVEKKGIHAFSKIPGVQPQTTRLLQKDVVIFPYSLDYLIESQTGSQQSLLEFAYLKPSIFSQQPSKEVVEAHIKQTLINHGDSSSSAQQQFRVSEIGVNDIKVDHLNQ